MIFAQVIAGIIINVIVINDASLIPRFSQGMQCVARIDNISPQVPQIGWTTSDNCVTFVQPVIDPNDYQ